MRSEFQRDVLREIVVIAYMPTGEILMITGGFIVEVDMVDITAPKTGMDVSITNKSMYI